MIKIKNGYEEEVIEIMEEIHDMYEEEFVPYIYHHYTELIEMIKKGDIEDLFLMIDKSNRLECFIGTFEYIEDDYKYEFFKQVYSDVENGFNKIPAIILDEVKELKPKEIIEELESKDNNGYLTIYRGQGSKGKIEDALSWSLNIEVAKFFTNRFGKCTGRMYSGKVHIDNVICYLTNKNEEEILTKFENVNEILYLKE